MHKRAPQKIAWRLLALCAAASVCFGSSSDAFWLYGRPKQPANQSAAAGTASRNANVNTSANKNTNEISELQSSAIQQRGQAARANQATPAPGEHHQMVVTSAPIELQFEINAEEPANLEEQARQQASEQRQTTANGSAILEDLVNQFLARSREQQGQPKQPPGEREHEFSATISVVKSGDELEAKRPVESLQLLDSSDALTAAPSDDDLADKHIQYDLLAPDQSAPSLTTNKSFDAANHRGSSTPTGNFTLSPVRMGGVEGGGGGGGGGAKQELAQSQQVGIAANVSRTTAPTSGEHKPRAMSQRFGGAQPRPPYAFGQTQLVAAEPSDSSSELQQRVDVGQATGEQGNALFAQDSPTEAANGSQAKTTTPTTTTTTTSTPKPPVDEQETNRRRQELERLASKYAAANGIHELSSVPAESLHSTLVANNHRKPPALEGDEQQQQQQLSSYLEPGGQSEQNFISERFFLAGKQADERRYSQTPTFELSAMQLARAQSQQARPSLDFEPDNPRPRATAGSTTVRPHNSSSAAPDTPLSSPALVHLVHRATLDKVRNQIESSDGALADSMLPTSFELNHDHEHHHHHHQSRSPLDPHSSQQRGSAPRAPSNGGAPYVAALVNMTAPLILPLSASEAMETEQRQQQQQQQASGGARRAYRPGQGGPFVAQPTTSYLRPVNSLSSMASLPRPFQAPADELAELATFASIGGQQVAAVSGLRASSSSASPTHWVQTHGASLAMPTSYLSEGTSLASGANATQKQQQGAASALVQATQANKNANQSVASTAAAASPSLASFGSTTSTVLPPTSIGGSTVAPSTLTTTNGFVTSANHSLQEATSASTALLETGISSATNQQHAATINRRAFNLTRVEHISAECSNDLIRTLIIFNGTFKGLIYSSGYVHDPNCLYINGTGKTRYDFSIRLNQCGATGRQELHSANGPNEIKRRDQVMWNALSIQYNPVIEQEWDEHFRVSCEYGSDFWKTISFNPFNVETNTGSPVVFTVDPPQCQMEILRGHGTVGPRQEAQSNPVTVGDPLTLLVHMKSDKAGYDIIIKNCIAHNGGKQKMQLIDANGCVVNERFISPFRGMYNDKDLKHITLYAYMKAFRFTGSSALYVECEVHMCQSACPPQMCYWRRLS